MVVFVDCSLFEDLTNLTSLMGELYYIGVDVGTSSARAVLVTGDGVTIASATQTITILQPQTDFYEQSSEEIWKACCKCIQSVTQNVQAWEVKGIGFDATCSLVVLDADFKPIAVSDTDDNRYNVVMWMDHRAEEQARGITDTSHPVLKYIGGTMSLEMQLPKLMWLKKNMTESLWKSAAHFMDLPDFLTWKATGSLSRSLCSLVCKWAYQANASQQGWDKSFFDQAGLSDLLDKNCYKIGNDVKSPGEPCGAGLTSNAAEELGLIKGIPVSTSIIDAHAGGVGTLGCKPTLSSASSDLSTKNEDSSAVVLADTPITSKLALICGTSTCHMMVSQEPVFVPGVWGPYYSAMVPRLWLNEGGQSATGKLLDHIISSHPARDWVTSTADERQVHVFTVLNEVLDFMCKRDNIKSLCSLASQFHVLPDYHGNRSPLADPSMSGAVCGLRLTSDVESLAVQYLATIQSLAYGTRQIVEAMTTAGHFVSLVYICGGLAKNKLFVAMHADALGLPVVLPDTEDSVLLGAAILGAAASGNFSSVEDAMLCMSGSGTVVHPQREDAQYHSQKYRVFLRMADDQRRYREIMALTE